MSILLNVSEKITVGSVPKEYAVLRRRVLADGGTISDEPLFKQEMVQAWETKPEHQTVLGASKVSKLYGFPDGDYTFTRSGEATRTAQNGQVETVPSNFPVVNFDDGDLLGYYSQRAATNLLLRSEEFDNAYWGKLGVDITSNSTIAPDGTLTADKMKEQDGVTTTKQVSVTLSQTAGAKSFSFFAKKDERTEVAILTTGGGMSQQLAVFNIDAGTLVSGNGAIYDYANGWYRCVQFFTTLDNSGITCRARPSVSGSNTYAGVLGFGFFIWGAQFELGSVATSYIKTVDTTVTRPADVATASGLTLSPLSNVQFKANFPTDYPLVIAGLQATVSGYRTIRLELSPTEKTLFVDGVEADTDTGTYDWSGITSIELGHFDGGEQPKFEIADLRINE
jgi:hypothetical protein